jgi:hypothetical protein
LPSTRALKGWPADRLNFLRQRGPKRPMRIRVQMKSIGFIGLTYGVGVEEVHAEGVCHDFEFESQLP